MGAGDASEKLYKATSENGHEIDILVHNAGIAETADFTDTELVSIENMILVNALTGTKLLRLYGKDMKDRRRGQIVVMSSITGAVAGVPTTSVLCGNESLPKKPCSVDRTRIGAVWCWCHTCYSRSS